MASRNDEEKAVAVRPSDVSVQIAVDTSPTDAGLATVCLPGSSSADGKQIPPTAKLRQAILIACRQRAADFAPTQGPPRGELEASALELLEKVGLSASYAGWTMVVLSNEFWRDRVLAVPYSRRLLLLPSLPAKRSLPEPAENLAQIRTAAEALGMKVLVNGASSEVLTALFDHKIEAVVGVATLDALERAFDKIALAGIPALAIPLWSDSAGRPQYDAASLQDILRLEPLDSDPQSAQPTAQPATEYAGLFREARGLFEPAELLRLVPRLRGGPSLAEVNGAGTAALDPIAATETIAHDFLAIGGKYARPFITLAAYQALKQTPSAAADLDEIPDAVRRVALSIEIFHKASLVHDDIEDSDEFRYGRPTLHRSHGLPTAINVGDYLIGLGYSLVSRETAALGAEVVGDIVDILADAHLRLSEGQGAELLWRDARNKLLSPEDALEIYALKTSPAFEAALLSGLRCAGPLGANQSRLRAFCRHLGIAFQILNDLKDWRGDDDNKMQSGLDTLGGRPTVLWALAISRLPG